MPVHGRQHSRRQLARFHDPVNPARILRIRTLRRQLTHLVTGQYCQALLLKFRGLSVCESHVECIDRPGQHIQTCSGTRQDPKHRQRTPNHPRLPEITRSTFLISLFSGPRQEFAPPRNTQTPTPTSTEDLEPQSGNPASPSDPRHPLPRKTANSASQHPPYDQRPAVFAG